MQRTGVLSATIFLLALISTGHALNENDPCTNPEGQSGRCIDFRKCTPILEIYEKTAPSRAESRFERASRCGKTADNRQLVCCAGSAAAAPSSPPTTAPSARRSKVLPKAPYCGATLGDRIHGGRPTQMDEFAWTGLVEYRKPDGRTGFHCGASLINSRYAVTAAHCIRAIPRGWQAIGVRLGEWDLSQATDCVDGDCADKPVDMAIEKITVHEDYDPDSRTQYNDIALIRFTRDVNMTGFISPVCLPLDSTLRNRVLSGTKGVAVGWGQTESGKPSDVKLLVELDFQDQTSCYNTYRPSGLPLRDTQICAGGMRGQDTCSGDSGGPLTKLETSHHYLYGIVSFGPNKCGTKDVPGVYTNVVKFIDWIESNME